MTKIVGISGYARSGKSEVGLVLDRQHGFNRYAFADKVRQFAEELDPPIWHEALDWGCGGDCCDQVDYGDFRTLSEALEVHTWESLKDEVGYADSSRTLLQDVGSVARKVLGRNVWLNATMGQIRHDMPTQAVITDVRYPNEAVAVREAGGVVIRVERPGVTPANGHTSETALDNFPFDYRLFNDGGLDDLARKVRELVADSF